MLIHRCLLRVFIIAPPSPCPGGRRLHVRRFLLLPCLASPLSLWCMPPTKALRRACHRPRRGIAPNMGARPLFFPDVPGRGGDDSYHDTGLNHGRCRSRFGSPAMPFVVSAPDLALRPPRMHVLGPLSCHPDHLRDFSQPRAHGGLFTDNHRGMQEKGVSSSQGRGGGHAPSIRAIDRLSGKANNI